MEYYGQAEMTYDEAINEYNKTIYDDKVSIAFARLFCDYMTRVLGLFPVFIVVVFWLKDRRNKMNELINSKQVENGKTHYYSNLSYFNSGNTSSYYFEL